MKRFFAPYNLPLSVDIAILLLRLLFGIAFIIHGWGKIQTPMGWMGPDSFIPPLFQALAAISEFVGGIALVLGLFTRLAAIGIAITMLVAVYVHAVMGGDPFVSPTGGKSYELAANYLCTALLILAGGAGRFSIDKAIFGDRSSLN
ncbi:DoxX family protein [Mucilaginibacter terrae]|uniref:Oxidoreductase n=1 Tax=Mucilaginibacter terrae TaxID=1955052 RepID=A0ABU3GPZ1_9SPHI|nr:DoxX family protein [Mucilaginibacter terrae]MDT3401854.1 putative oxidoreductase [Mucilaginibacter terrae]